MAEVLPKDALERRDALPSSRGVALAALVLGALAMGISPIFVRQAEVGPFASAFWRVALALPFLSGWATWEAQRNGDPPAAAFRFDRAIVCAGLAFSADLFFWHLAILNTSVANATFLATLTSVWVVLGSGLLIGERVGTEVIRGVVLCLVGAAALIGLSFSFAPDHVAGGTSGSPLRSSSASTSSPSGARADASARAASRFSRRLSRRRFSSSSPLPSKATCCRRA